MKPSFGWLVGRDDSRVFIVAVVIASLGWLGTRVGWPPSMLLHEPGFELALFLQVTRQRGGIGYLAVNEVVVFAFNVLVWMAVLLVGGLLVRGIARAWRRSWLLWAFLIAVGVSVVGELTTYDNYWLPGLPNLSRPGWLIAPRLVPMTSFVIDSRTPLGLFAYPDRLATTSLAFAINLIFWTAVLYLVALVATVFLKRGASHVAA
jgi:hypothetical protein